MDAFLEIFGKFTVADAVTLAMAICFLIAIYYKLKSHFDKQREKEEKMSEVVERYHEWHQQSIDIQQQYSNDISELKLGQQENTKKLEQMDADNKKREQNRIRDRLLQSYRYYTSTEKNPLQAWTELESDTYWRLFEDYESVGGDGHMHSIVEPAMKALDVVRVYESERVTELMKSRK